MLDMLKLLFNKASFDFTLQLLYFRCDGENDCGDSSDEDRQNCKNFQCPENWFRCGDDRCIPMENVCNGVIDCKDGFASDERHPSPCPKNVTCPPEFFSCEETNICAHPHWVSDA